MHRRGYKGLNKVVGVDWSKGKGIWEDRIGSR